MRLERAEVDTILVVLHNANYTCKGKFVKTVFVHLLHLYYLSALYFFSVHCNACYYTYFPSPA